MSYQRTNEVSEVGDSTDVVNKDIKIHQLLQNQNFWLSLKDQIWLSLKSRILILQKSIFSKRIFLTLRSEMS